MNKNMLYNIAKNYVMKKITNYLGKVIEEDDRIVCYVNKNICESSPYSYTIACYGIGDNNKEIADAYKINKPIYYVLDNIDFHKKHVYIYGYDNCNVIIKNCNFNYGINISVNGECLLENTYIRPFHRLLLNANVLTLKNIDIQNEFKYTGGLNIGIGADSQLNIINSNFGRLNEQTNISLLSGKILTLIDSKIAGDNIECRTDNVLLVYNSQLFGKDLNFSTNNLVTHGDSLINANNEFYLNTNSFNPIKVISPFIILNDKIIESNNKLIELKEINDPLSIKRLELIDALKYIKSNVENNNLDEINKFKNELANRAIIKSYSKDKKIV